MADLFFRTGAPFTGTPKGDAKAPFTMVQYPCSRCGGQGGSEAWRHTGWTCYQCGGHGRGPNKKLPLYTAEKLAKLNATRDKKLAAKAEKARVEREAREAEAAARRSAFEDENRLLLAWLETVALDTSYDDENRRYKDGFLGDMLRRADSNAAWSEAQKTAVQASYERERERAKVRARSEWVGTVGERLTITVTVERESSFDRPSFMRRGWGSDSYETVWVTTLRDQQGNALIVKSPNFRAEVGSVITITGTVKAHDEYRGEQQTTLQRVRELPGQPAT